MYYGVAYFIYRVLFLIFLLPGILKHLLPAGFITLSAGTIYGPSNIQLKQQVKNTGLEEQVLFKEEVPQNILAKDMQHADALVLYSRYETFGCVVIEANACGIPAILSDLPVFREYIIKNKTGIFAKPNDPENLADTIINFIQQRNSFSQMEIANYTKSKFSYGVIAKQFDEVYKSIIK
jgi:glycosyltransferase involved in cell wall biosynthesis